MSLLDFSHSPWKLSQRLEGTVHTYFCWPKSCTSLGGELRSPSLLRLPCRGFALPTCQKIALRHLSCWVRGFSFQVERPQVAPCSLWPIILEVERRHLCKAVVWAPQACFGLLGPVPMCPGSMSPGPLGPVSLGPGPMDVYPWDMTCALGPRGPWPMAPWTLGRWDHGPISLQSTTYFSFEGNYRSPSLVPL